MNTPSEAPEELVDIESAEMVIDEAVVDEPVRAQTPEDTAMKVTETVVVEAGQTLTPVGSTKIKLQSAPSQPTVAVPGRAVQAPASRTLFETFDEEARQAVAQFQRELQDEVEPHRVGRLHYEIARIHEHILADLENARDHYMRSLEATPESLPTIVGARRVLLQRGEWEAALDLFDREVARTADAERKSGLLLAKGRVLEDRLARIEEAHAAYTAAVELTPADPLALEALEQADWAARNWEDLAEVTNKQANAIVSDAALRAVVLARRARILEVHHRDLDAAAQLYESALDVDAGVPGALDALKRLHYERKRWRDLVRVLEREARVAKDGPERALALYRTGTIYAEHLDNRREAIAALEEAANQSPEPAAILEALVRLYEQAQEPKKVAKTLARLVEVMREPKDRLGYLQRIGEICRDELGDEDRAIAAFQTALDIAPTYIPALRAAAPLYAAKERWDALIALHEAEAREASESRRRAAAHMRAAVLLERRGRASDAVSHYDRALTLDPDDSAAFRALARLYRQSQQYHKLVELYERTIDRVDEDRKIEYLLEIGDIYSAQLDEAEQAEQAYRRVLKLRPRHLGALHALQRVAEVAQHWRVLVGALEEEAAFIEDEREIVGILHRAGEVMFEQLKERSEAIACFRKVLDIDPNHRPTLATLGRIYHAEGRWSDLIDIHRRELEAEPAGPETVALLHKVGDICGRYLLDRGRAAEFYRKAIDLDPSHAPSLHALRRLLEEQKDWAALVELMDLERVKTADPQARAYAAFRAGEIHENHLEDPAAAERCYAEAAEVAPGYRPAIDALARVRTHLEKWKSLASLLENEAQTAEDPRAAVSASMRAGDVWMDHLDEPDSAIACYEKVLGRDPAHFWAMLRLEALYRRTERWEPLASLLRREVDTFHDPGAKAAALAEHARLVELHEMPGSENLIDTFSSILAARPHDWTALGGLERKALQAADPRVIASVDARLAAATHDVGLRSSYLTRQAENLERAGQPQALQLYRQVLDLDPHNRAALRGLRRVAEVLGDAQSLYDAACIEADVVRDPQDGAEAWMRAGEVALDQLDDEERAVEAFTKALAMWPDHARAADMLTSQLEKQGEYDLLVERLARAAMEAKDATRRSALAVGCARIHAGRLQNLGAALAVLHRHIEAQPFDARARLEQGILLLRDRRFDEARVALERCLSLDSEDRVDAQVHRQLAQVFEAKGDRAAALEHYKAAAELDGEDPKLLEKLVSLQMDADQPKSAAEVAQRLFDVARSDAERIDALGKLARARMQLGEKSDAFDAIARAIALGGQPPTPEGIIDGPDGWRGYLEALQRQLDEGEDKPVALYLEIARVHADALDDLDEATRILVRALGDLGGHPQLRFELGRRLLASKRPLEAAEQFQYLLLDDASRVEAWRHLAEAYQQMNRAREREMTYAALAVLEQAAPAELEQAQRWTSRWDVLGPGALAPSAVQELFISGDRQAPAADLLASMADALAKLRPGDLSRYGVTAKDRIGARSDHPLRTVADRIAQVFGVEEFDLYLHRDPRRLVVENAAKPSLMLPLWVAGLTTPQQVFVLSTLMFQLARNVHTIELFSVRELDVLLTAGARTMAPGFGEKVAPIETLDAQQKLILRALPRKRRRWFEAAAEHYARAEILDIVTFVEWSRQTARRVALIAADDLIGTMGVLDTMLDGRSPQLQQERTVGHPVRGDLLKVWLSRSATLLRQRVGLIARTSS